MKRFLLILAIGCLSDSVHAVAPGPLPELTLYDANGALVSASTLLESDKWALVVIDAALPSAYDMLNGLSAKEDSRGAGVTLVVIGSEADLQRLKQEFEKLSEARWLLSRDTAVIRDLALAGIPSMVGVDAAGQVAWQYVGVPDAPEKAQLLIQDWISR